MDINFKNFEKDEDWYNAGFRFVDWYDNKETRTYIITNGLVSLIMIDLGNGWCKLDQVFID